MATFFPRQTMEFHLEEPPAFRRFSFSLVEMAIVTGVALRLYRLVVLTHGSNSWLYFGGTFGVAMLILLGMGTAHLANYPLHQWVWRAPAFALLEVATEMVMSVILIYAGHEPNGTVRAHFGDLPMLLWSTLLIRGASMVLWSLLLAGLVTVVRNRFVTEDDTVDVKVG
jgi:hypothetical protein